MITHQIALHQPPGCIAAHANLSLAMTDDPDDVIDDFERQSVADRAHFRRWESGYAAVQSTRPQTIGYGLVDSPVLLAAWIYEKLHAWTDGDGEPESVFSRDEMLDNIMLYWLPAIGASASRLYWESYHTVFRQARFEMPFGITIFPREVMRPSRRWATPAYANLIYWNHAEAGGHFAAFEQPAIFTRELRDCFRQVR
jgi:pimeloyl-ACP methyl ester carboxylesterase